MMISVLDKDLVQLDILTGHSHVGLEQCAHSTAYPCFTSIHSDATIFRRDIFDTNRDPWPYVQRFPHRTLILGMD